MNKRYQYDQKGVHMKKVTVIGIDLAKAHFQIHANDAKGQKVFSKAVTPEKASELLSNMEPCLIGMEACGGSHYWARKLERMGHTVKLIPPQYVRAYVIGNHNDVRDAEAIAEAVLSKRICFVPIKSQEHQDIQNLHRIRQRLIDNKVALSNQIRGILYEYGIKIPQGDKSLRLNLSDLLAGDDRISPMLHEELDKLRDEYLQLLERIKDQEKKIESIAKRSDPCRRLMTIPGVGPLNSTAIVAAVGDVSAFKNGRHFAAWLGLVPGHRHTGGPTKKVVMLGITKRGDRYLRKLLIQGARAWLITVKRHETKRGAWGRKLLEKKHFNKVAVAVANKNARTIWALLARNEEYDAAKAA